jgi:hypothetical protein
MSPSLPLSRVAKPPALPRLVVAGVAGALLLTRTPTPAFAQPGGAAPASEVSSARHPRLHQGTEGASFPDPFWLSLLTVVAAGAAGAVAADAAAGAARWRRPDARGELGALGKVVVGSVAGVLGATVNPPGGAWWTLAATAAAAGVGAEGILLAAVASRHALEAERDRAAAEEGARRTVALAAGQVEALRRMAREGGIIGSGTGPGPVAGGADEPWVRAVDGWAERARAELELASRRYPAPGDALPASSETDPT